MNGLLGSLFQISTSLAERGVLMVDGAMRTAQFAVGGMVGSEPYALPDKPPLDGPTSLDGATSEFSNRLFRIWWTLRQSPKESFNAWSDLMHAARQSFGGLDLANARQWMALPVQFPLSVGTLMTQQILRGIYATHIIGPERVADFLSYMAETLSDVHVFVSLQYKDLIKRCDEQIAKDPGDLQARLRRARTLLKMGLFPEAVCDFRLAARRADLRADALRDSSVANYRAGRYREAVKDAVDSLTCDSASRRGRYWLWLAAQKLGGYPGDVPASMRMEAKGGGARPGVEFEDVAGKIGLDKTSGGRGTAVFDMDGDGYLDVVVASAHGGCSVYRNNGDGTFTDVSVGSGLDGCVNAFAVAVGDYNNDGLDDLYITRQGFFAGDSVLYRNNGDGTFTDVTGESGAGCWGPSFMAQWVDYDCDGNLDLFVCSNLGGLFDRTLPHRLFHNNGDGTFTEVTKAAGLVTNSPSMCGCWGDYDNDGFPDLFVSSNMGHSKLFRNNRDGTFTDVSRRAGLDHVVLGTAAFWCDYDNDGWLDLVQCTWSPEDDVIDSLFNGAARPGSVPMRVFHNNGDGTFTLKSAELGLTSCFGTMSACFGDFDNDGHVDFLLGNGDPHMNRTEPPAALEFDIKTGRYRGITFTAGLPCVGKGHGANMADLAGDGRLSLIIASGGAYPGDLMMMSVFRPKSLPGNYLNVRLVGMISNRNAIGARIRLDAGGRTLYHLVSGGSGFGCLPYEQHFGLGKCRKVDGLEIWWPSGLIQRLQDLPSNTTISIVEGAPDWQEVYGQRCKGTAEAGCLSTLRVGQT